MALDAWKLPHLCLCWGRTGHTNSFEDGSYFSLPPRPPRLSMTFHRLTVRSIRVTIFDVPLLIVAVSRVARERTYLRIRDQPCSNNGKCVVTGVIVKMMSRTLLCMYGACNLNVCKRAVSLSLVRTLRKCIWYNQRLLWYNSAGSKLDDVIVTILL